ncbi:MAG: outer membrane beta-barrel protein [Candidatus Binatia bacterium]
MKKNVVWVVLAIGFWLFAAVPSFADEPKPLEPGWLSLDGSVGLLDKGIAEGKGNIEKAVGINISGFFDTSYTYSSNHPKSPASISGRYFDKDHNKVVFNAFNLTIEKPEKDWGVGFKIVGDFGRTGELLREATLWGPRLTHEPSAELREAFLTTTIPIGEGLQVKAGKFVTPLGTEILLAPGAYNDNISRSYAFNFAVPLTHLGALFTYPVLKVLSVSAGLVTGWDNPADNNNSPSFLGGVNFTPVDAFALASNIIVGKEWLGGINAPTFNGGTRVVWSNVATVKPIDPLTMYLEYTMGHEKDALTPLGVRNAWWNAFAGILSYGWTDRFTTALRAEYFRDSKGARTGVNDADLGEITLTAAYKFTAKLLGRAEIRQDWADQDVFKRGRANADSAQTTFALQAIYGF